MNELHFSRRLLFKLSGRLGAAWLSAQWPEILNAVEHAHQAAVSGGPAKLGFFTGAEAAEVEAIAAQIIPTDDTPGAREARVVYFIDRALVSFDRDRQQAYRGGLKDLQHRVQHLHPGKSFSSLTSAQQIDVLKSMEQTEFFELVRAHTIAGFLANPEYGGNYNKVGWQLIGFQDDSAFTPPFGFYDRDYKGAE